MAKELVLQMSSDGGYNWFGVTFTGPRADEIAASYLIRKGYLVLDEEAFQKQIQEDDDFPLAVDAVYPTCKHGLSARLCAGPEHYISAEQERAMGW